MEKETKLINNLLHNINDVSSIFSEIPKNKQGFILIKLSKKIQKQILDVLDDDEIIDMLDYLDLDDITDIIQNLNSKRKKNIIEKLNDTIKKEVEFLLEFDPQTAAGLMNLDYVEVEENLTFNQLPKIIRKHEKRTGKFPTIFIVKDGFLKGELSSQHLILHRKNEKIGKYCKPIPKIEHHQKHKKIIQLFKEHPHDKIAVLDDKKRVLGIIYSDDILSLLEKNSNKSLGHFAGVNEEEDVLDSFLFKVKNRYIWLIINLATAFLAASVVGLFDETISKFVVLAMYMPIVAGMGGNSATQTLAVFVRGISLGEIALDKRAIKSIINEILAGITNGIIIGVIATIVSLLWNKNLMLGFVIGMAMIINLVIAGFFGSIIPLIMNKLGKDPAASATIFITTATDIFGFFAFLGLASLLL